MSVIIARGLNIFALVLCVVLISGPGWSDSARQTLIPELEFDIVCLESLNKSNWRLDSESKQFSLFVAPDNSLRAGETGEAPTNYVIKNALSPCFYEFESVQKPYFNVSSGITSPSRRKEIDGYPYTTEIGVLNLEQIVRDLSATCERDVEKWASSQKALTGHLPYNSVPFGNARDDYCPEQINNLLFSYSTKLRIHFDKTQPQNGAEVVFVLNDVYYKRRKVTKW